MKFGVFRPCLTLPEFDPIRLEEDLDTFESIKNLCSILLDRGLRTKIDPRLYQMLILWIINYKFDLFLGAAFTIDGEILNIFCGLSHNQRASSFPVKPGPGLSLNTIQFLRDTLNLSDAQKTAFLVHLPMLPLESVALPSVSETFFATSIILDGSVSVRGPNLKNLLTFFEFGKPAKVDQEVYSERYKFYFSCVWQSIENLDFADIVVKFCFRFIEELTVPWDAQFQYFTLNNPAQMEIWIRIRNLLFYKSSSFVANKILSVFTISSEIPVHLRREAESILIKDVIRAMKYRPIQEAKDPDRFLEEAVVHNMFTVLSKEGVVDILDRLIYICRIRMYSDHLRRYIDLHILNCGMPDKISQMVQTQHFKLVDYSKLIQHITNLGSPDDGYKINRRIILDYIFQRDFKGYCKLHMNLILPRFRLESRYFESKISVALSAIPIFTERWQCEIACSLSSRWFKPDLLEKFLSHIEKNRHREFLFCNFYEYGKKLYPENKDQIIRIFESYINLSQSHPDECSRGMGFAIGLLFDKDKFNSLLRQNENKIDLFYFSCGFHECYSGQPDFRVCLKYYQSMNQDKIKFISLSQSLLNGDLSDMSLIDQMNDNTLRCCLITLWYLLPKDIKKCIINRLQLSVSDPVCRFIVSTNLKYSPHPLKEIFYISWYDHQVQGMMHGLKRVDHLSQIQIYSHLYFIDNAKTDVHSTFVFVQVAWEISSK
jgi:hypothetical protein